MSKPVPPDLASVFNAYTPQQTKALLELRDMILETAAEIDDVGEIEETLKWGQPSFLTVRPKSGSTIRIDAVKGQVDEVAMYFICTTDLVERFKEIYPGVFRVKGNREFVFTVTEHFPVKELKHCIAIALTYHCT